MSSLPTSIAAGISQTAIQQSQTARANDAPRNRQIEQARQMKQLLDKHLQEVEDPSETDADHRSRIHDEQHEADTQRRRRRQRPHDQIDLRTSDEPASPEPPSKPASPPPGDDQLYHHLDIEA